MATYIIAGPCSFNDISESDYIIETAKNLVGVADRFRCKIFLGGTAPDRYFPGIGKKGIKTLEYINDTIIPTGTEIQIPDQARQCSNLNFFWIGARNCSNYGLLRSLSNFPQDLYIKRGPGMTTSEIVNLYDILNVIHSKKVSIIERGVIGIDRRDNCRWHIDLNSLLEMKYSRPDIFESIILDCSHSAGRKEFVPDIYRTGKAIGINNFMFECTLDGKSLTDSGHMLSVEELKKILR